MKLTIDFETRSAVDLKNAGLGVYANDPTSDILCLAVKIDDDETRIWANPLLGYRGDLPLIEMKDVFYFVDKADVIEAHNAAFEEAMWAGVGVGVEPGTSVGVGVGCMGSTVGEGVAVTGATVGAGVGVACATW